MDLETAWELEETAANVEVIGNKRTFADGILLMTYAIFWFSEAQRILSLSRSE